MITSCGLIFVKNEKILLCHVTGKNFWDLPKGIMDDNEKPIDTVLREVYEETGMDLYNEKEKLVDLGLFDYKKEKQLHLFLYESNQLPNINTLECKSYFKNENGENLKEVDAFSYVSYKDAIYAVNFKLAKILKSILKLENKESINIEKKREDLRRAMNYILRHAPDRFFLNPYKEGYVEITSLVYALRCYKDIFKNVTEKEIFYLVETDDKSRYSISNHLIKANYGHTIKVQRNLKEVTPPETLYHGTYEQVLNEIIKKGLKSPSNRFIFLTNDIEEACFYSQRKNLSPHHRKNKIPVLLKINAKRACENGVKFYLEESGAYAVEIIDWKYIERIKFPKNLRIKQL